MNSFSSDILLHFKKVDPIVFELLSKMPPRQLGKGLLPDQYFGRLCEDIVGQQLSVKAADVITRRFIAGIGGVITPEIILDAVDQDLRNLGLSWAKVKYVKDLAHHTKEGNLKFDAFKDLSNDEIMSELIKVKGIGPWTAEMFLIFTLGRPDVYSLGDLGLKNAFMKLYAVEDPKEYLIKAPEIVEKWSPYRSFGSLALWYSLDNET